MAVSRRRFLHHGFLAAAACWAKPLLAQGPRRTFDGNGNSIASDGNDPAAPFNPPASASSNNWQDHASALQGMTRTQFAGAVGSNFQVIFPDQTATPVWLTLMAVEDLPGPIPMNPRSFAVAGPQSSIAPATNGYLLQFGSSAQLAEGTYLFVHETLGKFALFTIPDGQQSYSAVINQLSGPTIIALPFHTGSEVGNTGNGGGSMVKILAPSKAVTASPATSSEAGTLAPEFSGNQVVRRGVLRD